MSLAPESASATAVASGDHVCVLYVGANERDEMLVPFLSDGLRAGQKCFTGISDQTTARLFERFSPDVEVESRVASGQFDVRTANEHVFEPDSFNIETIIQMWDGIVGTALREDGFNFVRLSAEATWWLTQIPGAESLIAYESALNTYSKRHPQSIWCLYDLGALGTDMVVDIVRTHPKVLLSGVVLENPYYVHPKNLMDEQGDAGPP
jgi:hypothetical protein